MKAQRWEIVADQGTQGDPKISAEGSHGIRASAILNRITAHQSVFSAVSSFAAGLFFLTIVVDTVVAMTPFTGLTALLFLLSGTSMVVPLLVGRKYPRWAGLLPVALITAATVYFLGVLERPQSVVNSLQELPVIALYLGWFFRGWVTRIGMTVLLVLLACTMVLGDNFGPQNPFSYPVGFGALIIMIFCFESGSYLQRELERRAVHDHLTGALNRRGLGARFIAEHERSRRHGTSLIVAIIDFDHFKQVNDELGHAAGDELLRSSVLSWEKRLFDTDIVGRIGGDEFVILLPERRRTDAATLLALLRQASDHEWSWGLAEVDEDDTLESALARADAELYLRKAKRSA